MTWAEIAFAALAILSLLGWNAHSRIARRALDLNDKFIERLNDAECRVSAMHRRAQRAESEAIKGARTALGQSQRAEWWRSEAKRLGWPKKARKKAGQPTATADRNFCWKPDHDGPVYDVWGRPGAKHHEACLLDQGHDGPCRGQTRVRPEDKEGAS